MRAIRAVTIAVVSATSAVGFVGCSNAQSNGWIEIVLSKKQMGVGDFCTLYFEITNKTKINFSDLSVAFIKRDASGNVIGKGYESARTPPNGSGVSSHMVGPCSDLKTFEFTEVSDLSTIDGDFIEKKNRAMVIAIPVKTLSKVSGITLKSPGGAIEGAIQKAPQGNLLEQVVSPLTGTRALWNKFKDEGGLDSNSDFYGLNITNISVKFIDDKVSFALLNTSKSTAPKQIRASLANVCKGRDDDWKFENGSLTKGEILSGGVTCSYLTNDTARNYDIVLERK